MRALGFARPVSLVALTAVLFSPGLWLGAQLDAAVFVLAGFRIRNGFMPYKDVWDHKPPGVYLLNALGQTILPWLDSWLVSWLLTVVFTVAAILILDALLRRRFSPVVAFLSSLLCLTGIGGYLVALGGGTTESFAILPLVVVLWAIASLQISWRVAILMGCLLGVACLLSLQALPAAAVLFVAIVPGRGSASGAVRRALAVVVGGVALPLAVAGWLAAGGAAADAFDQIVTYNAAYRNAATGLPGMVAVSVLFLSCLAVPTAITAARMVRRPRAFDRVDWSCLAWSVMYSVYIGYQGRIFLHYLILLIPPIVFLAGSGMGWLVEGLKSSHLRVKRRAIGLVTATAVTFSISAVVASQFIGMTIETASEARVPQGDTAAWVKTNTPTAATVFVWGSDPGLYLVSERNPYDRYVYEFPLITAGYWSPDRTATLLLAWRASPPPVIVESPASVPMFRAPQNSTDPPPYDTLAPLRDFVRNHYRLVATFGDHDIYLLVS
jgi:hypothetical protein